MDLSKKKLKQKCRKNQHKLALTFMGGDGDEYRTGEIFSEKLEGEIQLLFDFYKKQIKRNKRGCGGADSEKLREEAIQFVLNTPALRKIVVGDDKYAEDHASDYLYDLGHGNWGDSCCPRKINSLELTYFNDQGDEYILEKESR